MTDDDREARDPYPPDQQFGKAAAEDQEKVDEGQPPQNDDDDVRAANKAEPV
jgi:hypothetical protein